MRCSAGISINSMDARPRWARPFAPARTGLAQGARPAGSADTSPQPPTEPRRHGTRRGPPGVCLRAPVELTSLTTSAPSTHDVAGDVSSTGAGHSRPRAAAPRAAGRAARASANHQASQPRPATSATREGRRGPAGGCRLPQGGRRGRGAPAAADRPIVGVASGHARRGCSTDAGFGHAWVATLSVAPRKRFDGRRRPGLLGRRGGPAGARDRGDEAARHQAAARAAVVVPGAAGGALPARHALGRRQGTRPAADQADPPGAAPPAGPPPTDRRPGRRPADPAAGARPPGAAARPRRSAARPRRARMPRRARARGPAAPAPAPPARGSRHAAAGPRVAPPPPPPPGPDEGPAEPEASSREIQNVFLGLGALLLGVAAVVFAAVTDEPVSRLAILLIATAPDDGRRALGGPARPDLHRRDDRRGRPGTGAPQRLRALHRRGGPHRAGLRHGLRRRGVRGDRGRRRRLREPDRPERSPLRHGPRPPAGAAAAGPRLDRRPDRLGAGPVRGRRARHLPRPAARRARPAGAADLAGPVRRAPAPPRRRPAAAGRRRRPRRTTS